MPRAKSTSRTVIVLSIDDRLKLRWTWTKDLGGNGRRFHLALGLPDTGINRRIAEAETHQIELDLHTKQFDPSLKKYTDRQLQSTTLSVVALYEKLFRTSRDTRAAH